MKSNHSNTGRVVETILAFVLVVFAPLINAAGFIDYFENPTMLPCMERLKNSPEFDPIRTNFLSKDVPFARYANKSKPTQGERALIMQYMSGADACRNSVEASKWRIENGDPVKNQIFDSSYSSYVALVVRLYNGEVTYGEFHQQGDRESAAFNERGASRQEEVRVEEARVAAARKTQEQQEGALQRANNERIRRETAKAFERAYQPVAPAITTRCSSLGGITSCVTR
jgi:hypothetical protein